MIPKSVLLAVLVSVNAPSRQLFQINMARVIDPEKCVACGSCIGECPVEAIKEGDVYTIDADACIDCGACEATCPNEAIAEA